ncbi:MAG: TrmH family RNA methyltransferase [Thermoleophilia bacterium]|nr:TrmH family RNA methyltransferase [Thermoleophilia bacterium]
MLIAVAHNLASLHNVGAIFRTADGAGFERVLLSGYTGCPPDTRIAKVALGAEEALGWEQIPELDQLMKRLEGVHVVLLEQHASSLLPTDLSGELPTHRDVALVVCDELYGAPEELVMRADTVLELPMRGMKQSLNVSIAFGIAAYAVAHAVEPLDLATLRSRQPHRVVRAGVLTKGRTQGETPN